jgi:histidine triad (HIT) family protein
MTCIFCQIIARRLPAEFLHEDEDLVVIKDINPAAPIHVLIIPKKHIDSMNSLDPALAQIFPKMMLLAKEMAEKLGTKTGYRLVINCGREAGQVIFHLHMHLMGGYGREMGRR